MEDIDITFRVLKQTPFDEMDSILFMTGRLTCFNDYGVWQIDRGIDSSSICEEHGWTIKELNRLLKEKWE